MAYSSTIRIATFLFAVLACFAVEAGEAAAQDTGNVAVHRAPATNAQTADAPAAERVVIKGVVADQDGRLLPNATVEARHATDPSQTSLTTTAHDGSYALGLEPGRYHLTVTPPEGSDLNPARLPDQTIAEDVVLNIALIASAAVQVQGRLLDGHGDPLEQVSIRLASDDGTAPAQIARTDADGRFAFEVLPGEHHFQVRGEGRPGSVASPRFEAESSFFTVDDDVDLLIALPFQPVTVRVQDREGQGLVGVAITAALTDDASPFISGGLDWKGRSVYDDAASARLTNEAGTVSLFLLPTAYDLTARPRAGGGLLPETVPCVAVAGAATQVIVFDPPASLNAPPLAVAGADRTARVGQPIQLDGSGASDPEGEAISYRWRLALPRPVSGTAALFDPLPRPVSGTAALFDPLPTPVSGTAEVIDADTMTPSFVAHAPGVYDLDLVVNDGTLDSRPDRVRIRVTNTSPTADAGADREAAVNETVLLDGAASTDPDGDPISYRWSFSLPKPTSGTAELIDPHTATPSFIAYAPGAYDIELVVSDGASDSPPDLIVMTVPDAKQQTFFVRLGQTERSAHRWLQDQRWPRYVGIGAMAVGQVIYVRAQYANDGTLIHPSQTIFDFGFNLSAYVMIDRFTDYAGVSMLQNWLLQAVINTTFDHPVVWPEEPSHYDLLGVDVPKVFYGERRWAQLGIGAGLIVVPRIVRKLRDRG